MMDAPAYFSTLPTAGTATTQPPDFVLDLLDELRRSNYRPTGWIRFLGRSWRQSRETADGHPALFASWIGTTGTLLGAQLGALRVSARLGERQAARRAAPWALLCLSYTAFDAYAHLGLNNTAAGAPVFESLGWPNLLTLTREVLAGTLWGHLLAGHPAQRSVALAALLVASATDVADGMLARRLGRQTRLGQYLDSVADFSFWSALALTLWEQRLMPRWLLAMLFARWLGPMAFAFAAYFWQANRIPIGSTLMGKAAGIAQAMVIATALAPEYLLVRLGNARPILHLATATLLAAAPLSQLHKVQRERQ